MEIVIQHRNSKPNTDYFGVINIAKVCKVGYGSLSILTKENNEIIKLNFASENTREVAYNCLLTNCIERFIIEDGKDIGIKNIIKNNNYYRRV